VTSARVPAVILKCVPNAFPYGSLAGARSLGRLGAPIVLVHPERAGADAASRFVRANVTLPLPSSGPGRGWVEALVQLARSLGSRAVLIPVDDIGAMFVDDNAASLSAWYRFPRRDPGLARSLADKQELFHLCRRWDVPTCDAEFPRSRDEVRAFAERARFPIVLKSIDPITLRFGTHADSVAIARDESELMVLYARMESAARPNVMLQEYIPGDAGSVWMFNGYFDARSECLFGMTGYKVRQFPIATGVTSLGTCAPNPTVHATTLRFMRSIGYRGIVDMGYRYDARDRRFKLLDVNPRIGATFRLFVDERGMDVARALYLDLTGEREEISAAPSVPAPRRWVVENFDAATSFRLWRARELSPREWLRSLAGISETAWFALDDPLPFALMSARSLGIAAGNTARLVEARASASQIARAPRPASRRRAPSARSPNGRRVMKRPSTTSKSSL
jgi:predicted ATP-grasp superfamily ATP-dependent carboligase